MGHGTRPDQFNLNLFLLQLLDMIEACNSSTLHLATHEAPAHHRIASAQGRNDVDGCLKVSGHGKAVPVKFGTLDKSDTVRCPFGLHVDDPLSVYLPMGGHGWKADILTRMHRRMSNMNTPVRSYKR